MVLSISVQLCENTSFHRLEISLSKRLNIFKHLFVRNTSTYIVHTNLSSVLKSKQNSTEACKSIGLLSMASIMNECNRT